MKGNANIKLLLQLHQIFAYELADELGISLSTYTVYMRKELSPERRVRFYEAIAKIRGRKQR